MTIGSSFSRREFLSGTISAAVFLSGSQTTVAALSPVDGASQSKSKTVQTDLGPLSSAKLGFTQSHEHVCSTFAGFWGAWPAIGEIASRMTAITPTVATPVVASRNLRIRMHPFGARRRCYFFDLARVGNSDGYLSDHESYPQSPATCSTRSASSQTHISI